MLATTSPGAVHRRRPELGSAPVAERAVYRPRNPTATPLYPIVQHHLETFLARALEADPLGDGAAFWVENDFRAYLRCGILAHGFARARCDGCGAERLIAFSCKGRGVCPSCNTRRMVEVAAHLNDDVLPPLPIRQWVLSLPKRLRPFLHQNPALAGAVLAILKERLLKAGMLTTKQACAQLGVSRTTLGRLRAQGKVTARICNDKGQYLYWLPEPNPSPTNDPLVTTAAGGAV